MSELHTYRITYRPASGDWYSVDVQAFTAADAIEQWRSGELGKGRRLVKVEALPGAPEHPKASSRYEWVSIPLGGKCPDPPIETVRASTPDDRIEALEAALRERTAERAQVRRERDSLIEQIDGLREHLRARTGDLIEVRNLAQTRLDAINLLAWIAWPNGEEVSRGYTYHDLVEAVRKIVAERDELRDAGNRAAGERDALQKRIDAARDRVRFIADSDDRDRLAAILDGRELESKDPAPGKEPKP